MNWLVVEGGLLASGVGVAQPGSAAHRKAMHRSAAAMKTARSDRTHRVESLVRVEAELFIELYHGRIVTESVAAYQ